MFSNFVSGFAAVVNEIDEGGLDDYSLQVEGQEDHTEVEKQHYMY